MQSGGMLTQSLTTSDFMTQSTSRPCFSKAKSFVDPHCNVGHLLEFIFLTKSWTSVFVFPAM
jgi:hypothetical protein